MGGRASQEEYCEPADAKEIIVDVGDSSKREKKLEQNENGFGWVGIQSWGWANTSGQTGLGGSGKCGMTQKRWPG